MRRAATETSTRTPPYPDLRVSDRAPLSIAKETRQPSGCVLVVDDEPSICRALSMALTRAGYQALTAASGDEALAIVAAHPVDVMVIDLRIPDMRGDVVFELAAASEPHLRDTTLFMTGDISERAHKLILSCHCPYLRKPFELNELLHEVGVLAVKRRALT